MRTFDKPFKAATRRSNIIDSNRTLSLDILITDTSPDIDISYREPLADADPGGMALHDDA